MDELLAFVYERKDEPAINAFFKTIFDEKLIKISKKLLELINEEISNMDDMFYFSSFIHILISLKKTKLGLPIKLPSYLVEDVLSSSEFSITKSIKKDLVSLDIDISDDELVYIAIQLKGSKYFYNTDRKFEKLGISLKELSSEVVFEAAKKLNIKIDCDDQLILGLSQHLSPALYRINMGIRVKNPLIHQIKKYYGELFQAVNYGCKMVFSKYNITMPQDEIGYITRFTIRLTILHLYQMLRQANIIQKQILYYQ